MCAVILHTGAGSGLTNSSPFKVYHITKFYEPSDLNNAIATPEIGYVSSAKLVDSF